jgi:hypothetical protein
MDGFSRPKRDNQWGVLMPMENGRILERLLAMLGGLVVAYDEADEKEEHWARL